MLYVLALRRNLFSIAKAMDKGLVAHYTKDTCKMFSEQGYGPMVMYGECEGNLWRMQFKVIQPLVLMFAYDVTSTPGVSIQMWHRRLAHIGVDTIKQMHNSESVGGLIISNPTAPLTFCDHCAISKSHRIPFPVNAERDRAKLPGEYYHDGCLHFVLFKDDYSNFRILRCIKQKSDTLTVFRQLLLESCRETCNMIKVLRTDRGGEFTGGQFTAFLKAQGIRHDLTAPHSHEQNSVAECEKIILLWRNSMHVA